MSEIEFDPEVYVIEDDIINHFLSAPFFAPRDPLFIRILMLFITRKHLTQKTIQDITGMSAGKISEEVNNLLEMGLIEIVDKSKKGKLTYSANSAGIIFLNLTKFTVNKLVKWEQELSEIKKELEQGKKEFEHLNGFKRIYQNTSYYVDLIKEYKKMSDIIDKYTKSIKNANK
ncbi:MAG: hypothetical protein ACFFBP_05315 [Promethearchaeota archaeon]